jgi:hypothetical protein
MEESRTILLEQYKMYVELTDRTSERRLKTNNFYLSIISALIVGFLTVRYRLNDFRLLLAMAIFINCICLNWISNIKGYRSLNTAKFKVIKELEQKLSYACFDVEWKLLEEGQNPKKYRLLSKTEIFMPWFVISFCVVATVLSW